MSASDSILTPHQYSGNDGCNAAAIMGLAPFSTLRFATDDIGHIANVLVKIGIACDHKTALKILRRGVK